jgi:nucleotide-binding universal stress UspA family protein
MTEARLIAASPSAVSMYSKPLMFFSCQPFLQVSYRSWTGRFQLLPTVIKPVDLVVLGQCPGDDSDGVGWLRPDDVMIDAGRPVLIVPCAGTFERVGRRVLMAWDETREANRPLHDALPLIDGAEAVTVTHVGAHQADLDRDRPWLDRIVRHLARHGTNAQPEESARGGISISDVLLSRAADLGADMIVAGAYHHSQLRESLLGGVSRSLLDQLTVPELMSH